MTVLWNISRCSLLDIDRRFRGAYCLHKQVPEMLVNIRLHGLTFQKTAIFILVAVRSWNLTWRWKNSATDTTLLSNRQPTEAWLSKSVLLKSERIEMKLNSVLLLAIIFASVLCKIQFHAVMLSCCLQFRLNGNGPREKRSNNVTLNTACFSFLFYCNGMLWREGDKSTKMIKERKKREEGWGEDGQMNRKGKDYGRRGGDTGVNGIKERKKGSEGWRHEINYFPLNFNGL
jgi:hypothetical protein